MEERLAMKLSSLQANERYKMLAEVVDEFISLDIENITRMLEPTAHSENCLWKKPKQLSLDAIFIRVWVCLPTG